MSLAASYRVNGNIVTTEPGNRMHLFTLAQPLTQSELSAFVVAPWEHLSKFSIILFLHRIRIHYITHLILTLLVNKGRIMHRRGVCGSHCCTFWSGPWFRRLLQSAGWWRPPDFVITCRPIFWQWVAQNGARSAVWWILPLHIVTGVCRVRWTLRSHPQGWCRPHLIFGHFKIYLGFEI